MRGILRPEVFDPKQEMSSRQVEIHYNLDEDSPTVDIHSHSHYEIYLFCEGDLERYVVGAKSYTLQRGDLLLIPPMVMHHPVFQEEARRYERYVLWLSQEYWEQLIEGDPDLAGAMGLCRQRGEYLLRFPSPAVSRMLERELKNMWAEFQGSDLCRDTAIRISCLNFLVQLNRGASEETVVDSLRDSGSPLLEQVIAYIHRHYGQPITLQDTARRFFVSPSTVEHLFTQKLGLSFYRYVTKRRMLESRIQIAAGVPIKEVCRSCGYTDYSNFYKAFTKEVGMPPSQYRALGRRQG